MSNPQLVVISGEEKKDTDPMNPGQLDKALPATRLLEKRRMVAQVQEALENQKIEFAQKEEILKKREETLRTKDLQLQESLIGFSKFLQEAEISQLESQLIQLKHEKNATHADLERMMFYHKYLETVIETSEGFNEINDLLMRHATLQATNEDLKRHVESCSDSAEVVRTELQAYVKSSSNEILNLDNSISVSKQTLEKKKGETAATQLHMDSILHAAATKTLARSQICMAAEYLFQRICKLSNISHFPYNNPLKQLDCVGDYISDLNHIIKAYKIKCLKKEHEAQRQREKEAQQQM